MKKITVIFLCIISAVFTIWYMHFEAPWTNDGAISSIGLDHPALFIIWGVLTFSALTVSELQCCKKERLKIILPLIGISALGMALTLIFRFDYDIKPDYYLHCAGSLIFSVVEGASVFLIFFFNKSKTFAAMTAIIMLSDLVFLFIFKENGLIETVPVFAGYIMLSLETLRKEKYETAR